ncbi:hypothetical protein CDAR_434471 [Caerostris darwini]|uniref:Uncharacterized protein n=1 Tax=Caerostris darwini TaxID=1538125 RepID=A0AAV4PKX2_9ARAC|nr:hypothetical protein CDAR_434471 [Caerostris darwini]
MKFRIPVPRRISSYDSASLFACQLLPHQPLRAHISTSTRRDRQFIRVTGRVKVSSPEHMLFAYLVHIHYSCVFFLSFFQSLVSLKFFRSIPLQIVLCVGRHEMILTHVSYGKRKNAERINLVSIISFMSNSRVTELQEGWILEYRGFNRIASRMQ